MVYKINGPGNNERSHSCIGIMNAAEYKSYVDDQAGVIAENVCRLGRDVCSRMDGFRLDNLGDRKTA